MKKLATWLIAFTMALSGYAHGQLSVTELVGFGAGEEKLRILNSNLSTQRSTDSAANAANLTFAATIPADTKFMIACGHGRDNDTASDFYGTMTVNSLTMTEIGTQANGTFSGNSAGVNCFYYTSPPTGAQNVVFDLTSSNTYDYLRITTYYFNTPAQVSQSLVEANSSTRALVFTTSNFVTTEPCFVLGIWSKYYTNAITTTGATAELFDDSWGADAARYVAAYVEQTTADTESFTYTTVTNLSWGGSIMMCVTST